MIHLIAGAIKATGLLFLALVLLPIPSLHAAPFESGERLEYTLYWGLIEAGRTVMEVGGRGETAGRESIHLVSQTRSSGYVSSFYDLNNRIDSNVDTGGITSLTYELLTVANSKERRELVRFDPVKKEAQYERRGKIRTYTIPPKIYDSLSSIYYLRTIPFVPGKRVSFQTFSRGDVFEGTAYGVARERITVGAGSFDTVKVLVNLKEGDVFKSKGESFFWFTDDAARIPVRIKTKVPIGYISADLQGMTPGKD